MCHTLNSLGYAAALLNLYIAPKSSSWPLPSPDFGSLCCLAFHHLLLQGEQCFQQIPPRKPAQPKDAKQSLPSALSLREPPDTANTQPLFLRTKLVLLPGTSKPHWECRPLSSWPRLSWGGAGNRWEAQRCSTFYQNVTLAFFFDRSLACCMLFPLNPSILKN